MATIVNFDALISHFPSDMEVFNLCINMPNELSRFIMKYYESENLEIDERITNYFRNCFKGFAMRCELAVSENGQKRLIFTPIDSKEAAGDPKSTCGGCNNVGVRVICQNCNLMHYCNKDCLEVNQARHKEICIEWQNVGKDRKPQISQKNDVDGINTLNLKVQVQALLTEIENIKKTLESIFISYKVKQEILRNLNALHQSLSKTVASGLRLIKEQNFQQLSNQFVLINAEWELIISLFDRKIHLRDQIKLRKAEIFAKMASFTTTLSVIKQGIEEILSNHASSVSVQFNLDFAPPF